MKKEYIVIFMAGLLILAYVLDAIVNPLMIKLATPYHFFDPQIMVKYPFTSTSIIMKSIALFIIPLWLLSFFNLNKLVKGGALFLLSALTQLYTLQAVATVSRVIPLEWSLSLTLAAVILLIPTVAFLLMGLAGQAHQSLTKDPYNIPDESKEEDDII